MTEQLVTILQIEANLAESMKNRNAKIQELRESGEIEKHVGAFLLADRDMLLGLMCQLVAVLAEKERAVKIVVPPHVRN